MASEAYRRWWENFNATGDICPIRLGASRENIRTVLGDPDDVGATSRKYRTPAIYKYDRLEFHFGPGSDDGLEMIFMANEGDVPVVVIGPASEGGK